MTERYIDENGYLRIDHNPVSKTGVYTYYGQEINLPPRAAPYRVLRSPEVLEAAVDLFNGSPIRIEHKFIGNVEGTIPVDSEPADGVMLSPVFDGETLYVDLSIWTQKAINFVDEITEKRALEGKKPALSMGYSARYALQNGEYNGQTYDAVMVSIESGNHLALLAGDGRIDDAAFIKDGAAIDADTPDFDFTILNTNPNHKGDDMPEKLAQEQNQPPIDDDSNFVTKQEFQSAMEKIDQVADTLGQVLSKIAEAEGKQAANPDTEVAPEADVKDSELINNVDSPDNPQMMPTEPEENKVARVEDHAAIIGEWTSAHDAVKPYIGVCTASAFPTAKSLYRAACDKVKVIAGSDPKAQFMAYLSGRGNTQPITAYATQAANVADGKAKGGIPLTRAEMSANDWSEK